MGRKDNGRLFRGGRRMRGSLSRYREFPLQVGPDFSGGATFVHSLIVGLVVHYIDIVYIRQTFTKNSL